MSEYYLKLNIESSIKDFLVEKINNSSPEQWVEIHDLIIYHLSKDILDYEPKILDIVNHFDCQNKLSIFKFLPNTSYSWHYDGPRNIALNFQIQGTNSFCAFGKQNDIIKRKYSDVQRLIYDENSYYLLDVSKDHCVFNFNEIRYVLSIGFPKSTTFIDVNKYLIENNLLD